MLDSGGRPAPEVLPATAETEAVLRKIAKEQGRTDTKTATPDTRIDVAGLQPYLLSQAPEGSHSASASLERGGTSRQIRNVVGQWLEDSPWSLAASRLGQVAIPITREELRLRVEGRYAHLSYNKRGELAAEFDLFLNRMHEEDLVCVTSGGRLFVGRITGGPERVSSLDERAGLLPCCRVEQPGNRIRRAAGGAARTAAQPARCGGPDWAPSVSSMNCPTSAGIPRPRRYPRTNPLCVPEYLFGDHMLRCRTVAAGSRAGRKAASWRSVATRGRDLLQDQQQLIFYGPPGTGKTWRSASPNIWPMIHVRSSWSSSILPTLTKTS